MVVFFTPLPVVNFKSMCIASSAYREHYDISLFLLSTHHVIVRSSTVALHYRIILLAIIIQSGKICSHENLKKAMFKDFTDMKMITYVITLLLLLRYNPLDTIECQYKLP